ncbi:hypothetical protein I4F81_003708 [Pyropia yezoensis]|uniref:Uncharacterized protein n=1 Tax=Pyropia yezoensis TaxID=2788 RepID=A0ACC3BSY2_PYRYE|nr:hypothetical protein I4F81_003708 [Neopyropia yezoensis]
MVGGWPRTAAGAVGQPLAAGWRWEGRWMPDGRLLLAEAASGADRQLPGGEPLPAGVRLLEGAIRQPSAAHQQQPPATPSAAASSAPPWKLQQQLSSGITTSRSRLAAASSQPH